MRPVPSLSPIDPMPTAAAVNRCRPWRYPKRPGPIPQQRIGDRVPGSDAIRSQTATGCADSPRRHRRRGVPGSSERRIVAGRGGNADGAIGRPLPSDGRLGGVGLAPARSRPSAACPLPCRTHRSWLPTLREGADIPHPAPPGRGPATPGPPPRPATPPRSYGRSSPPTVNPVSKRGSTAVLVGDF